MSPVEHCEIEQTHVTPVAIIRMACRLPHTYRSWFEFTDTAHIVRHTIRDPADIELIPVEHGDMTRNNGKTT
jgi:hypothetical protein